MESVPIREDRPLLDGVLGPLTTTDDKRVRSALGDLGVRLRRAAEPHGGTIGWNNEGFELSMFTSGQLSIDTHVEVMGSAGSGVTFLIAVRPSWFYGRRSPVLRWDVEAAMEYDAPIGDAREQGLRSDAVAVSIDRVLELVESAVGWIESMLSTGDAEDWTAMATADTAVHRHPGPPLRICADFNGLVNSATDPGGLAVVLDTFGALRDLSNLGVRIYEGLPLICWDPSDDDEDLEGRGVARFDPINRWWVIDLDSEGVRYVPAGDRSTASYMLCVECGSRLSSPEVPRGGDDDACAECGTSRLAALAPPSS